MPGTSSRALRALLQLAPVIVVATLVGIAASDSGGSGEGRSRKSGELSGTVTIDGAAALQERLEGAAQRFERRNPDVRVTAGASGDESAIAIFCAGEVDIAAVARRLDRAERRACRSSGTKYQPIEVAREGIALVVSGRNHFASCLGIDQARAIWRRAGPVASWSEIDPRFPDAELETVGWKPDTPPYTLLAEGLFGPVDPLTRNDYEETGDAAELAAKVAASPHALGYLPVGELKRGAGVRPLALDAGRGCVTPTIHSVRDGSYPALSRPLYLDVRAESLRRPEVRRFIRGYLKGPPAIGKADGVIPEPPSHRVYRKFTRP
jgi:phosphate transport system substrate-binding protein